MKKHLVLGVPRVMFLGLGIWLSTLAEKEPDRPAPALAPSVISR